MRVRGKADIGSGKRVGVGAGQTIRGSQRSVDKAQDTETRSLVGNLG